MEILFEERVIHIRIFAPLAQLLSVVPRDEEDRSSEKPFLLQRVEKNGQAMVGIGKCLEIGAVGLRETLIDGKVPPGGLFPRMVVGDREEGEECGGRLLLQPASRVPEHLFVVDSPRVGIVFCDGDIFTAEDRLESVHPEEGIEVVEREIAALDERWVVSLFFQDLGQPCHRNGTERFQTRCLQVGGNAEEGRDEGAERLEAVGVEVSEEDSFFRPSVEVRRGADSLSYAPDVFSAKRFEKEEDDMGLFIGSERDVEPFFAGEGKVFLRAGYSGERILQISWGKEKGRGGEGIRALGLK